MERVARLVVSSTALRRKIWASLPFSVRIAEVFSRLASMATDAFGKVVFGEFLKHEVIGLPDIYGKPALEVAAEKKLTTNRLPPGYGKEFGKKCFLMLMGKTHNPQLTEELMSEFAVEFLESKSKTMHDGITLQEAQNFVMRSLQNSYIDWMRHHENARRNKNTLVMDDGEEDSIFDNMPTFDEDTLEKLYDERMLPKVRQELRAIHPSAEQYVKLMLDNHSDREILGDPEQGVPSLLDHPFTSRGKPLTEKNWSAGYKGKIFDVLKEQFADLRRQHTV